MTVFDLAGTIYKILPEVYAAADAEGLRSEHATKEIGAELGYDVSDLHVDERFGLLIAHRSYIQAQAMCAEWARRATQALPAKRTGKRAEAA